MLCALWCSVRPLHNVCIIIDASFFCVSSVITVCGPFFLFMNLKVWQGPECRYRQAACVNIGIAECEQWQRRGPHCSGGGSGESLFVFILLIFCVL